MKKICVRLKERSYDVFIGFNVIDRLGLEVKKILNKDLAIIITNPRISGLYLREIRKSLKGRGFNVRVLTIPDSEKAKSFLCLSRLLNKVAKLSKEQKPFIVALGGGVVGDVSGFVASIYKRGIPYIQVPTTLLAQIDSSIGGKTAIDLSLGKNLAGAFYQPRLVFVDVSLLKTLSQRQISSGVAEMIKYALIKDSKLFGYLEDHWPDIFKLKPSVLIPAISTCVRIKSEVVSKDEFEKKGLRTTLNFGHTVGHAIETASNYRYNHGEAIALGMIVASRISQTLGLISPKATERVLALIKNFRLPTKIKKINLNKLLKIISYDKKFLGKKNRFVLLKNIGNSVVREGISQKAILTALKATSL